jgi:hypothetical protein
MRDACPAHWLVVVRAEFPDAYARLMRTYAASPLIEVRLDRRQLERRQRTESVARERRQGDRRRIATGGATGRTHRLIQRTEAYEIVEADSRARAQCPDCQGLVEFEMPRFGELPARVDLNVVHVLAAAQRAEHFVEIDALRATGRSMFACRLRARSVPTWMMRPGPASRPPAD